MVFDVKLLLLLTGTFGVASYTTMVIIVQVEEDNTTELSVIFQLFLSSSRQEQQ